MWICVFECGSGWSCSACVCVVCGVEVTEESSPRFKSVFNFAAIPSTPPCFSKNAFCPPLVQQVWATKAKWETKMKDNEPKQWNQETLTSLCFSLVRSDLRLWYPNPHVCSLDYDGIIFWIRLKKDYKDFQHAKRLMKVMRKGMHLNEKNRCQFHCVFQGFS